MPVSKHATVAEKLRRGRAVSVLISIAILFVCELPILLTVAGFATLSAGAAVYKPPYWAEVVSIAVLGVVLLMMLFDAVRRKWLHTKRSVE